ncbi:conserved hypothetical protein [Kribbella flavida DSM 17836]|uniref:Uncharacterized protein n=1 Tax=Kribbella flavida (strain DSM 17836 / JCM 10339 / NBRC 14399) TaxID=479435 RepID=D2Q2U2_KRIFD|nr:hypothetical protein [Kribbella flavida]ADB30273.1 conserved hypothetical protein [Kribbella flavida DSM 17836]
MRFRPRPVVLATTASLALAAVAAGGAVAAVPAADTPAPSTTAADAPPAPSTTAADAPPAPSTTAADAASAPGGVRSPAATDTDGDALPDLWETNGYDADGNGTIDVDLPALGATPTKKDLFVEMDYMAGRLASTTALDRIVEVFATAPVSNPDGSTGIRLHLDAGAARGTAYDLGGGNEVPYDSNLQPAVQQTDAIKAVHFAPARQAVFHYMLWADDYDNTCSSGNAFAIPNDTFIVTMGPKCKWTVTENMAVGTFIHELGHNLGLTHGGTDHANYKPNYLSVMNYFFQFDGVPRTSGSAWFSYSSFAPPALTETSLRESVGLNTSAASTWRTKWKCPDGTTRTSGAANLGIDWNCDGDTTDTAAADVNDDNRSTTLAAQNNWASIRFGGGDVGGGGEQHKVSTSADALRELTRQEVAQLRAGTR